MLKMTQPAPDGTWGSDCSLPGGSLDRRPTYRNAEDLRTGGFVWRKRRGLLTVADLVADYRVRRRATGPHMVPMREDILPSWEVRRV
jgi:hypothetical protein